MSKILIVEDDKKLRQELETFLNKNGFEAKGLDNFDNTIQDILEEKADLVLLDINLPYTDGEFVCKEVRKASNVPIIMVTSRDNEIGIPNAPSVYAPTVNPDLAKQRQKQVLDKMVKYKYLTQKEADTIYKEE